MHVVETDAENQRVEIDHIHMNVNVIVFTELYSYDLFASWSPEQDTLTIPAIILIRKAPNHVFT